MSQPTVSEPAARRNRRGRARRAAPLAACVLVVGLLVGVAAIVAEARDSGAGSASGLPLLRLATPGMAEVDAPVAGSGRSPYLLAGKLPGGTPEDAPIHLYRSKRAPAELVGRLARALGLRGDPDRGASGWQLRAGSQLLTVEDGGAWAWRLGPEEITPDTVVQCFRAPCPYEGPEGAAAGRRALSPDEARRIAGAVLRALGLPTGDVTVRSGGAITEVLAPRRVNGQPTQGIATTISVGGDRKISGGQGWLGQPTRGQSYPLVSAEEGFRRLQAQPFAEILLCRPLQGGGCAPPEQSKVTGAELGLMLATDSGRPVLVPAWLFTVAGQPDPLAVPAVHSRFLAPPVEPKPAGTTAAEPGGGGGSQPQSVPPAPAASDLPLRTGAATTSASPAAS